MISRRTILLGGLVTIIEMPHSACAHYRSHLGCAIAGSLARELLADDESTTKKRLETASSSGDREFDQNLAHSLSSMTDVFSVLPYFAYFKRNSLNALATHEDLFGRADGTVLFGRDLLFRIIQETDRPDVAVAGICAHEFGHILQFKKAIDLDAGYPTVKRSELHADFLAGFYAGARKLADPDFPAAVIAQYHESFGDYGLQAYEHHGTPKERADAVVAGFTCAFTERVSKSGMLDASLRYMSLNVR